MHSPTSLASRDSKSYLYEATSKARQRVQTPDVAVKVTGHHRLIRGVRDSAFLRKRFLFLLTVTLYTVNT
jgi:hypothetical protein